MAKTVRESSWDEMLEGSENLPAKVAYVPDSFEDAVRHLQDTGELVDFKGNPYQVVDKKHLVGKPFVIMDIKVRDPELDPSIKTKGGRAFVIVLGVSKEEVPDENGNKTIRFAFADGGTGVCTQLRSWLLSKPDHRSGLVCQSGLTVSEYDYDDAEGNVSKAQTYYIA